MFKWSVACGIFSYYLFFLGLIGQLNYPLILIGTALFLLYSYFLVKWWWSWTYIFSWLKSLDTVEKTALFLIVLQVLVNLVGALGPELGYDAVWYHLTIPRIWLLEQRIFFIENGPFSYSLLPKLLDLLYLAGLSLTNEVSAKVLHWFFGILTGVVTYKIARHFTDRKYALLAVVVFFSNLVVGWQSITAYIDLGRTFFESLALLAVLYATKQDSHKWRYWAAVLLGLAILTKLIAVTSLLAVLLIFLYQRKLRDAVISFFIAISFSMPWFILNYIQTSNPVFPIFSQYELSSYTSLWSIITIWFQNADPLSPLYIMLFPIFSTWHLTSFQKYFSLATKDHQKLFRTLTIYCALTIFLWWLTPRTGGGRFILAYLPALSVLVIYPLSLIKVNRIRDMALFAILAVSLFSSLYRMAANAKYLPVLVGTQSRESFIRQNLPQNFGDNWYYLTTDSLQKLYKQPQRPTELHWKYQE